MLVRSKFADDHPVAMRHMLAIGRAAWVLVYLLHRPVRDIQVGEIINLWPARLIDLRYPKMPSQQRGEWQYLLKLLIGHARAFRRERATARQLSLWLRRLARLYRPERRPARFRRRIPSKTRSLRSLERLKRSCRRTPYRARQTLSWVCSRVGQLFRNGNRITPFKELSHEETISHTV